jgi:hypothetical protein
VSGGVEIERGLVATEKGGELVMENFDDLLAGFDGLEDFLALCFFAHGFDEAFRDREFDIGLKKGEADFTESIVDVFLGDLSAAGEIAEGLVEGVAEIGEHDFLKESSRTRQSQETRKCRRGRRVRFFRVTPAFYFRDLQF